MTEEKFILDATAGFRMMWFNKKEPHTIYLDQRPECEPDIVGDFRDLRQFADETFRFVIFDPPHIIRRGDTANYGMGMHSDYGTLEPERWQKDIQDGFNECWRVLKTYGVLVFKWSNQQISSEKILALCSQKPLIYQVTSNKTRQKSHSQYQTLWFCFMKFPEKRIVSEVSLK